jgi:DNA repair protein RadC
MESPEAAASFLKLKLARKEHEVFLVLFLDSQNRVIETKEMFRGTIDSASVYPREVAKEALALNAAGVILAHNHPSGEPEPSKADRSITDQLQAVLGMFDIRTLDHLVIGGDRHVSFASKGWL